MTQTISTGRAIWLMAQMRLRRQANQIGNNLFRSFRKKKTGRVAVGRKSSSLWLMTVLMVLLFSFTFVHSARSALVNMQCRLVESSDCQWTDKRGAHRIDLDSAVAELQAAPFSPALVSALTMEMSLLFFISVLIPLSSKELAQPDWDLEWLVTMPLKRSTLLWARVLERSAGNSIGWLALTPPILVIAWYSGLRWSALPAALLGSVLLLPLAALLHTLADTGLRMWLPASQLRNLQAVASLFSMPLMYFVMALGLTPPNSFVLEWARAFPAWTIWTPPGLVIQVLQAHTLPQFGVAAALLLAQIALLLLGGVALLRYQLRNGVVGSSSRASARRPAAAAENPVNQRSAWPGLLQSGLTTIGLSTIKRRELRLLGRDRNFLVQTLLLPVVIVGSQMFFNGKLNSIAELGLHHTTAAAIAFGIGSYVLMLSAFQTLNNEGQVLWLLYTFPRSLESVLREKAQLWGALALLYPLAVFGATAWYAPQLDGHLLGLFLVVVIGIPVYSVIAVALGVFACDPLAQEVRARVRPTYVYLYMLLASFYTYSVYAEAWSQKLVVMVLTGSLALALWQKARDELPYLLDPAASPGARVSTADGLIAATMFFVLQALIMVLLAAGGRTIGTGSVVVAFGIAGAVVYALARLLYWRNKTAGVPAILRGGDAAASLRIGLALGALAAAAGVAYLSAVQHAGLLPPPLAPHAGPAPGKLAWLFGLTVVAAPLCEEFIFRGLIFGGLRRSMGAAPAMLASAAVFAIVHPALSILPVFGLGLCAAYAYERSKTLLAPMLVHALYNASILGWQLKSLA